METAARAPRATTSSERRPAARGARARDECDAKGQLQLHAAAPPPPCGYQSGLRVMQVSMSASAPAASPESHKAARHGSAAAVPPHSAPAFGLGAIESVRSALGSSGGINVAVVNPAVPPAPQTTPANGAAPNSATTAVMTVANSDALLCGPLNKRGAFFKNWLPRYAVLSRGALCVYRKNPFAAGLTEKDARRKLLKDEIRRGDALRVEVADSFRHRASCFVVVVRKRPRLFGRGGALTSSSNNGELHRKESNLDTTTGGVSTSRADHDGPVLLVYLQASREAERARWLKALQRWIDGESPLLASPSGSVASSSSSSTAVRGRALLHYVVSNAYSNYRYGQKVSSSSHHHGRTHHRGGNCASPSSQAGRAVEQDFPVLANLVRELHECEDDGELVYILDQILGEVQEGGASSATIKKLIATAGEVKLEACPQAWTDPVKSAYAEIMRALHVALKHGGAASDPVAPRTARRLSPSSVAAPLSVPVRKTSCLSRQNSDDVAVGSGAADAASFSFHRFYKLGRKLGAGGFSVVHIATHRETRKQVAVKCIAKASLGVQETRSLKQEVEIMSTLDHPNIVPLLDYFDEEQYYYLVTPLCTGGELFDALVKRKSYTESDARALLLKLAGAIEYLHARGIVHRDLKPENILLKTSAPGAEIMIADFGFARSMTGARRGTACGTPGYVAPEVVRGEPYGSEVDCWSLGVILFILLCGYPPFPGSNHAVILDKVAHGEYEFESPFWDSVSCEAKDLVSKLLMVDRRKRLRAADILTHPWMTKTDEDEHDLLAEGRASGDLDGEAKVERVGSGGASDLLPALYQLRKHSLTHGSPKIRPSDMDVDAVALDADELSIHGDKELLERELLLAIDD